MSSSERLNEVLRRRKRFDEISQREEESRRDGLMIRGMSWDPTQRLGIKEQIEKTQHLTGAWQVLARMYDLKTEYAFAEYATEAFVIGIRTLSEFAAAQEEGPRPEIGALLSTVRNYTRRWFIENNTAPNKLIVLAWKVCLVVDVLGIYSKQESLVKPPPQNYVRKLCLPTGDTMQGIPVMQYTQSQCLFVIQQITNCWGTLSLDKDDYEFIQLLRFRFAVICFLVFSEDSGIVDVQGMRETVSARPGGDGIVDIESEGSGIIHQASDTFVERGIVFFADVEKAFHLRNSMRVLYQQINHAGVPMKPRGLRNEPGLSKEARAAFLSWFSSALRSPQQNQWRSDFVTKFACSLLRPGMRSMYYNYNTRGAAPVIFEAVQGMISPESALSDIYPTENQQAVDMFQTPKSMFCILDEPDHPTTTWVKESAILYVWGLAISQFTAVSWNGMWRQLDFVEEGIAYVIHIAVKAAPYRILRNANTFYVYRSSESPNSRVAYVCSDIISALHTWLMLNMNLPAAPPGHAAANNRDFTFSKEQKDALSAFYKTVFVDGRYVENYKPVEENLYKKRGIDDKQFAKKV
ncbi:MAG: hypothetical protein AB7P49_00025 [Bdellovibrionales bacterium]